MKQDTSCKDEMMEPASIFFKVWDALPQCISSSQKNDHNQTADGLVMPLKSECDGMHDEVREPETASSVKRMNLDRAAAAASSSSSQKKMSLTNDYKSIQKDLIREIQLKEKAFKDMFLQHELVMTRIEQIENDYEIIQKELMREIQEKNDMFEQHKLNMMRIQQLENDLISEKTERLRAQQEREEAFVRCQVAVEKQLAAETHLQNMKDFIKEAKVVDKTNETLHILLKEQIEERMTLHNILEDLKGKVRVHVRIRPLSDSEMHHSCATVLIKSDNRSCELIDTSLRRNQIKTWHFDKVLSGQSREGNSQEELFQDVKPLVTSAIDGFNVSIFAYGQTGGGKTYTMGLDANSISQVDPSNMSIHENVGLTPRIVVELFSLLDRRQSAFETIVTLNMFELYNHYLRDLLCDSNDRVPGKSNQKLQIKLAEHTNSGLVEVDGAISVVVRNPYELISLLRIGTERRATGSTFFNIESSRSHLVTSILIKQVNRRTKDVILGKLSLVDLAGSERVSRSKVEGSQLKETQSINKSLSALGDVINALNSGLKHVPYRNHPLTMLMSDSLGGNAKTQMYVCCSPADYNKGETSTSLDFALRCKSVKNKAKTTSESEQSAYSRLQTDLSLIETSVKCMSISGSISLDKIKERSNDQVIKQEDEYAIDSDEPTSSSFESQEGIIGRLHSPHEN